MSDQQPTKRFYVIVPTNCEMAFAVDVPGEDPSPDQARALVRDLLRGKSQGPHWDAVAEPIMYSYNAPTNTSAWKEWGASSNVWFYEHGICDNIQRWVLNAKALFGAVFAERNPHE